MSKISLSVDVGKMENDPVSMHGFGPVPKSEWSIRVSRNFTAANELESTHRVETSANAVRYAKACPSKNVTNIHPQLFQVVFNV